MLLNSNASLKALLLVYTLLLVGLSAENLCWSVGSATWHRRAITTNGINTGT